MHGLSSSSATAFVSTRPAIGDWNDRRIGASSSLTQDGKRFRPQPTAAMLGGHEAEIFGFTKDILTAGATGATGDLIAQFAEKRRNAKSFQFPDDDGITSTEMAPSFEMDPSEFDLRRTAAYATFAAGYTGAFQHVLFDNLHERISDPVERLAINQGLMIPLLYYSLLTFLVPKLRARSPEEEAELRGNINVMKMIPRNWAFWLPLQFIQFNFIDPDFQVIYCSFLGLIWNVCLSFLTAGGSPKEIPQPTMADLNLEPASEAQTSSSAEQPVLEEAYTTVGGSFNNNRFATVQGPFNSTSFASTLEKGINRQ